MPGKSSKRNARKKKKKQSEKAPEVASANLAKGKGAGGKSGNKGAKGASGTSQPRAKGVAEQSLMASRLTHPPRRWCATARTALTRSIPDGMYPTLSCVPPAPSGRRTTTTGLGIFTSTNNGNYGHSCPRTAPRRTLRGGARRLASTSETGLRGGQARMHGLARATTPRGTVPAWWLRSVLRSLKRCFRH